jgi:uncharacterized protein YcaQ
MTQTSLEQVNQFVLRKQHLTDDSQSNEITQIVKDLIGLHATVPTTPYVSLLTRTRNFQKTFLEEELYIKKSLGKIRCMRKTVHILPKEMIPVAFSATRKSVELASEKYSQYLGVTREKYESVSRQILTILKGKAMDTSEIKQSLKTERNISTIVNLMCDQGLLIRGKPAKSWKSNIHSYHLFEDYFPSLDLNAINEAKAKELLVRNYISTFGPATENDIAWWSGFLKGEIKQILKHLEDQITQLEVSGLDKNFLMFDSDTCSLNASRSKDTVNLLPPLDPYLMGYKDRERYLDSEYYDNVFDRGGNATSTILLNGKVIGVWDIAEKPEPTLKFLLFHDVEKTVLSGIHVIAKKTGKFMLDKAVQIKKCDSMVPLTRRNAGGFMTPLKDC